MKNVELQADTFDVKAFHIPEIETAEYQSSAFVDVKLLFSLCTAYDEFDERDIVKNEDGSSTVSMRLPNDYWFYDIYSVIRRGD